eukprot:7692884-Heterocapsa_arctica.AAC.1
MKNETGWMTNSEELALVLEGYSERVLENDEVPNCRFTYWDDAGGGMLDAEQKKQAHSEELDWCRKMGVWETTSRVTMDTE